MPNFVKSQRYLSNTQKDKFRTKHIFAEYNNVVIYDRRGFMQNDIFSLLMMILMLENGGGAESINQLVIMFLLMNARSSEQPRSEDSNRNRNVCARDDGYTF